jgi:hypothetical protein
MVTIPLGFILVCPQGTEIDAKKLDLPDDGHLS